MFIANIIDPIIMECIGVKTEDALTCNIRLDVLIEFSFTGRIPLKKNMTFCLQFTSTCKRK